MRIRYIMHADFEPIGVIEEWARENQYFITGHRPYKDAEPLPTIHEFDFLIVLGGPQSALQLDKYPYLKQELELIANAISHNKLVLGICLGAQLIATALGVAPSKSPEKEVGVFPIVLTDAGQKDHLFKDLPTRFEVLHWHAEMFGLPKEAVLLAKSPGCPHQAFKYSDRVYGLQFHLEMTKCGVEQLLAEQGEFLDQGPYVASPTSIINADLASMNKTMKLVLSRLSKHL